MLNELLNSGGVIIYDKYIVFNDGRVYSIGKAQYLKPQKNKQTGYLYYDLRVRDRVNKKVLSGKLCNVHRLVAETFIPNPLNKKQVNHIDGNKENNFITNLEWATSFNNVMHSYHMLPHNGLVPVAQLTLEGVLIKEFISQTDAALHTGVDFRYISLAVAGKQKTAGGFKWIKLNTSKQNNNQI
jgi:hypothetical protein